MRITPLQIFAIVLFSCEYHDTPILFDRCQLSPDPGPCRAIIQRFYYDREEGKCKAFDWGGCDGVVPFQTLEECRQCEKAGR